MDDASGRVFLFLQGPHGPFCRHLAGRLAAAGGQVRRVAFNAADAAEWDGVGPLDRHTGGSTGYAEWLERYFAAHAVTDIVLYGDSRPEHAMAVAVARQRGVICHSLEEGYLRPNWVTYERWGNNGNSPLLGIPTERISASVGSMPAADPPQDGWGAYRPHLWHSLMYHGRLLLPSRHFGRYRSRRGGSLWREAARYLGRLATLPLRRGLQRGRMRRLAASGRPCHLVLLQLSFDASMQSYSGYRNSAGFVRDCLEAFARGAPADDLLVFKSHPFDDGRERLGRLIAREAQRLGVAGRVVYLDGGNGLAAALDGAGSVVTVNSTGAQQALCRGLPVVALGQAVYARPGLVSQQSLAAFFAAPERPDGLAYARFRRFLLETSQIEGAFYSRAGMAALLERLPAAILASKDPYERLLARTASISPVPAPPNPAHSPQEEAPEPCRIAV